MNSGDFTASNSILKLVQKKIEVISKIGYGEVRIVIRNGDVYRILSTEDELIEKNKKSQ